MKELFIGFLTVSLSGSLVLCVILLLRLAFRKSSRVLICVLWFVAFVRLLLPIQLETPWSLRPETPVWSGDDAQIVLFTDIFATEGGESVQGAAVQGAANVDPMAILTAVWAVGVIVLLTYMVISYFLLGRRVGNAQSVERNVYTVSGLESAFVFGYLKPRIFLPTGMDGRSIELVMAHELMHIKRADHWLKLLGFICLAIHWYNPLVWLAYILLCRDVETACDEQVICNLGADERKAYATALLACGAPRKQQMACPVAFGEIGISGRIRNVLSYKKPAVWVSVIAVVAILFVSLFLLTDPMDQDVVPPYYNELVESIGEPVEVVCQALEITPQELGEPVVESVYVLPDTIEYLDVPLYLELRFFPGSEVLYQFRYYARYSGISQQASQDAAIIANQLWDNYGKGYQWEEKDDPARLSGITAEEIYQVYQVVNERTGSFVIRDAWDLTKSAPKNVQTYLKGVAASDYWNHYYADKAALYGVEPHYYLEFSTGMDSQEGDAYIVLSYNTGWQPGSYQVTITRD